MRFLATITGAALALTLSLSAAQAACSSGVSRTISVGGASTVSSTSGQFRPGRALRENEVVLTFDDGPMPGPTTRILRVLDEHCVQATFFVVGAMARANPHIVRQMAARGHTVGTHSQSHANLADASHEDAIREIKRGYASVSAALGSQQPAPFFRFPYLASTSSLLSYLSDNNSVVFDGPLIDSADWRGGSSASIRQRILSQLETRGRGVILLHDIKSGTANLLPDLLDDLEENGYKIVHLVPAGRLSDTLVASGGGDTNSSVAALEAGSDRSSSRTRNSLSPDNVR